MQVIILDFNIKPLEGKTLSEATKVVQGDVSDPASWKQALKVALDTFGKLTIVCNNAGICTDSLVGQKATLHRATVTDHNYKQPMHEMPIATLDRLLSVNLKAIFVSGQVIFPYFMENNIKGAMVNTIRYDFRVVEN